jgi:hypothetical protein
MGACRPINYFLDEGDGEEKTSGSILDVGVRKAMTQVRWDRIAFVERGGLYHWTRRAKRGAAQVVTRQRNWNGDRLFVVLRGEGVD